jgi:membrane associated rhomboid family serine protease
MGIYDRDYYRRDSRNPWSATSGGGQVVLVLIVVNVVVFVAQLASPEFTGFFILDVDAVLHGQVWRLVTYAFLHDPGYLSLPGQDNSSWILHIVFNMLLLWFFGRAMEELYGAREFLVFYLMAAIFGGVIFTLESLFLRTLPVLPRLGFSPCLGASGAVMAVMTLYACHYPRRTVLLMFVLPVQIWVLVVIFVVWDGMALLFPGFRSGTAVSVHLAGAGLAYCYFRFGWRWLDLGSWLMFWRRGRPRLRVVRDEEPITPEPVGPPKAHDVDEHLEAQVDAVLEKVSRYGQDSLTESEREILFKASEVYRRRRPR